MDVILMKKWNLGFTLIELLAVMIILGVIAIPKIQDTLYNSQDNAYKLLVTRIENKANDYVADNNLVTQIKTGVPLDIYIQTLINEGYLETKDLDDPRSDSNINPNTSYVRFTLESSNLLYKANIALE
jgi:prepilin-type N-terminal cleavage/methylation domain-containing protein